MIFTRSLTTITALFFLTLSLSSLRAEDIDVIVMSGQSNMQGTGKIADLSETWLQPLDNVFYWNGKEFVVLEPGKTKTSGQPTDLGPEIGLAHALAKFEPNKKHYIVKFFRSGQPLHHGWNRNRWEGDPISPGRINFYPGEAADDPNIGKHYSDMMTVVNQAFESLRDEGHQPKLRAIVWMQGEQDSKHEQSATEYAKSIKRFKSRIEEDLESPSVPFVMGQVLPFEPALPRFTHRDQLRKKQLEADMRSESQEAVAGCWTVPTDGMRVQKDTVHYDALGQTLMGTAFALGMYQAEEYMRVRAEPTAQEK